MSGFLNQCCTFESNRRTVGYMDTTIKAEIVVCNICGTSYTKTLPNERVLLTSELPIIKTNQSK